MQEAQIAYNGESFPVKARVSAQHHVVKSRVPTTPARQNRLEMLFVARSPTAGEIIG